MSLGRELADYLTCEAPDLGPRLAALPPARAGALIAQAERHRIGPLLRDRLLRHGLYDALPAEARTALDAQYLASSARALARYHELGALLGKLADADIPVIALKGIYLAKALYPEPGLRPMGDMDLLFRIPDLQRVQGLLLGLGYAREEPGRPIEEFLPRRHQLPQFRRRGATSIEVHMAIERPTAGFPIDYDALWARARHWPIDGRPLMALAPQDLLLHLCLHGVYHHGAQVDLMAVMDLARVVALEPLDWDAVVAGARRWGAERPAYYGLELARRLLSTEVPADVLAALRPAEKTGAFLAVAERAILTERSQHGLVGPLAGQASTVGYLQILDHVRATRGWRARLGLLGTHLFPSRAVLEQKYPRLAHSGRIRLMHGLHWLVALGHFAVRMPAHWRYWTTARRMDKH